MVHLNWPAMSESINPEAWIGRLSLPDIRIRPRRILA